MVIIWFIKLHQQIGGSLKSLNSDQRWLNPRGTGPEQMEALKKSQNADMDKNVLI